MGRRTEADELENRIRELRQAAGLSQGELAARAGITRQAVSAIEAGGYLPNTAVSLRLSRALGCTVEDLFRLSDISLKIRARAASGYGRGGGGLDGDPGVDPERGGGLAAGHDEGDGGAWQGAGADRMPGAGDEARVQVARIGEELVAARLSGPDGFAAADGIGRPAAAGPGELDVELLVEPDLLERTVVLLGCDPSLGLLAEHVHRQSSEFRVLWRHAGSIAALRSIRAGEAHIAGTHLWDPESGESNLPVIRRELAGLPVTVIAQSEWQQGLMVAPGNPKGISSVADLARSDVSIVNREPGSGSRVLLDHHLAGAGVRPEWVSGYDRLRRSHADIAAAVRDGLADAGPGILATARALGLGFIPLQQERYDLVIPTHFLDHRPVRAVLDTLTGRGYRREIDTLGGYDSSLTGSLIAEIDA